VLDIPRQCSDGAGSGMAGGARAGTHALSLPVRAEKHQRT
jgi:hypothetical protein